MTVDDEQFEQATRLAVQAVRVEVGRLVRKLEDLRRHRGELARPRGSVYAERRAGELNGLDMAIRVLKGNSTASTWPSGS